MTKIKQKLSLFLVIALIASLCATVLTGCKNGGEKETEKKSETTTEAPTEGDGGGDSSGDNTDGKIQYTVSVKTEGGMMLKGVTVEVYDGDEKVGGGITDDTGSVAISLPKKDGYIASAALLPDGYTCSGRTQFLGTTATLSVTSSVIKEGNAPTSYELGDVMHDFTFTTYDGKEITLSKVLEEKEMLLLNFWYDGCSWCTTEMPEMNQAYNLYKDKAEIIALSPYDDDDDISDYIERFENGLDFPIASDMGGATVIGKFGVTGYPTTIVIDRYGVVCLMVTGYTSYDGFEAIFKWFTGDYTQQLLSDPSVLTPRPKPSDEGYGYEMPSSDEINDVISPELNLKYYGDESEYAWPYLIGEKNGQTCIMTSNEKLNSSFSTLYVDITLKAGETIALDYWASTESGGDIFYVMVDGQTIHEISGASMDWETCYPYVALKDGTYKLSLHYLKDSSEHGGDDRIYIKGIRILSDASKIDTETYIIRQASTIYKADGSGYESYVKVILGSDNYYHVGSADGPLLLANMLTGSHFSTESVYEITLNNSAEFTSHEGLADRISDYATYASNAAIAGYCPVTEELRGLLETVAEVIGIEENEENQWLQMCVYYDAYGTNGAQMSDPIKGLTSFCSYDAVLGTNHVEYTRLLMPRGYYYKFVPEVSGAYRLTSNSTEETLYDGETCMTEGVICDENLKDIHNYQEWYEKISSVDENNICVYAYMEAGETYYVNVWYYDIYATGTIEFNIERVGDTADIFTLASNSFFTFEVGEDGETDMGETVAGGVDVMLVDGIYYVKNEDGSQGPVLYADFTVSTGLFEETLLEAIENGGFNFVKSNLDMDIEGYLESFAKNEIDPEDGFIEEWGEAVYQSRIQIVEDVQNGVYHGIGDRTEQIKAFADNIITDSDAEELNGCIVVTEELAELLQAFMDTYTFDGVDHSWTKLCFFYKHYGPAN